MKVKNYSYETFPSYDQDVEGIIELKGIKENLRCRLYDEMYQDNCLVRFLIPNTILDENRKYPLVIHVQGSGWYKQDMFDHIFDFMPIVKKGFAFAIIQYRHSPEHKFPAPIIDVKKAIRYITQISEKYPIDMNNLFLSGDSSGGHVAMMTAVTYNTSLFDEQKSILPPLKGIMDFYGVMDFLNMNDWYSKYDWLEEKNTIDFMGEDHMDEDSLKKASPMYYIDDLSYLPPLLILHGSKDHVVPFTQSVNLYKKCKEKRFEVSLARVKDADHGRSIFYVNDVYDCIEAFLNTHCTF